MWLVGRRSGDAAVGVNDLTVDPASRSGQPGDNLGDVFGLAEPFHRRRVPALSVTAGSYRTCVLDQMVFARAPDLPARQ